MHTRIYWSIQHACRALHEMRFTLNCWWLSRQVELLKWRLGLDTWVPQPRSVPERRLLE